VVNGKNITENAKREHNLGWVVGGRQHQPFSLVPCLTKGNKGRIS
jgi:hypothetical protein